MYMYGTQSRIVNILTDRAQPPNTDCRHLEKMPQPLKRSCTLLHIYV